MSLEDSIRQRIRELIAQSGPLSVGNEYDQVVSQAQISECSAWITAAQNVVHLLCPNPTAPYRLKADRIAATKATYIIHTEVAEMAAVLRSLAADAETGLLTSVADRARAETFDNFLDQADAYLNDGQKRESGVIAGVVFEDVLRRVCRKLGISEKGQKLDTLISELASRGELSSIKAKRARVAAGVRTKASHAQWDEFEIEDVRATIEFTKEFIASKLDA